MPAMNQAKVEVLSVLYGIETPQKNHYYKTKYRLSVVKGVIETKENVQLYISVSNFSDQSHRLPKKTVLEYVSPNPLVMITILARI